MTEKMHVGVCRLTLHLPGNRSLKEKRRAVRSACEKLRHRFGVSISEVEGQELWQSAVIGLAAVSGDPQQARLIIDRAVAYAEERLHEVQVLETEVDVLDLR